MKFVIQRVKDACVVIGKETQAKIGKGFLVLVGVCDADTRETADKMVKKLTGMRIFEDAEGKTNLSLHDVDGQLLIVSQFTLYADCKKGNRPSFLKAGSPKHAETLYSYIVESCRQTVPVVRTGIFGADMQITLTNDGPFTILLDSTEL